MPHVLQPSPEPVNIATAAPIDRSATVTPNTAIGSKSAFASASSPSLPQHAYHRSARDANITTTITGDSPRVSDSRPSSGRSDTSPVSLANHTSSPTSKRGFGISLDSAHQRSLHSRFSSFSRQKAKKQDLEQQRRPPLVKIHLGADHRPISVLSNISDSESAPNSPFFQDLLDSKRLGSSHSEASTKDKSGTRNGSPSASSDRPNHPGVDSRWASPDSNQHQSAQTPLPSDLNPNPAVNMHQTSSRLLRMNDDDRPFCRDFKDLFSTLMVSLKLDEHRVGFGFSKVNHTFTSKEAMQNLSSLKFSQSNRMADPKDASRVVITTTTTTFSMARDMALGVLARFLEARLVESLDGKSDFDSDKSVWQMTSKGLKILSRFCTRNGIRTRKILEVLENPRNALQILILERDPVSDRLIVDRAMIEVIFRRFAGETPNVKTVMTASDNDSISENTTGLCGVRCVKSRKATDKSTPYIFNGKSASDWLLDCCMVIDRRESYDLANLFIRHDLINMMYDEMDSSTFVATKNATYKFTEKGMRLAGWVGGGASGPATGEQTPRIAFGRDSNNARTEAILADSALRLLFREYLIETHCEENMTFWVDVQDFLEEFRRAKESHSTSMDHIKETLATAYGLYNAFLAPGSPCELNIDHNLRNALAGRMTRAFAQDSEVFESLDEVAVLFAQARTSVFKLMASDSVPKFSRDPKYAAVIRDRNLEHLLSQNA